MKKLFVVLAAMLLLVTMACSSGGNDGSSSSDTPAVKSDLQGTWGKGVSSITFMSDKTYTIDTSSKGGTADAWGTYSTTGNQLTMTDSGGTSACFNTTSQTFDTGHYTYSISGNTLTLTLVSDSCSERTTTLFGSSLTGQNTSDNTAPSVPTNLSATAATTSQINLTWSAASDNVGVAGYKVFRNGTLITTTAETVFSDTWLTDNTTYSYAVSAYDAAGNDSGKSISASATTAASTMQTYSVSGKISGAVVWGVTVTITGSISTRTTTDSNGNYSFSGAANGSYTVTPSLAGYTFFPISTAVTVNGTDNPNTNFTATANTASTYSISGTVSGAVQSGVTITLTGTSSGSTLTDSSGNYSFSDIDNGNYTITASKTGYTFSPVFSITVNGANITGQNFTATANVVLSSAKAITAFSIGSSVGAINEAEKTIAVIVPFGTDVTALVATFTITGESVYVNLVEQTTGQTLNDFTHPVVYTVKAADASTTPYTVTVTLNRLATAVTVSMTPNSPPAHAGIFCTATGSITGSYTVTDPNGGSVITTEWYDEYGGVSVLRQTNTTTLPSGVTSGTDTLPGKFLYHHIITFKVTADGVVSDSTSAKIL